jgi:hypothetical protein
MPLVPLVPFRGINFLTAFFTLAYISRAMSSSRTFFYFAFTYRFFFFKESGPAKFENDVLMT